MIDLIQILLAFVIVTLTVLLFVIGLQFFQILKEFRKTVSKMNNILDDTGRITKSVADPIEGFSELLMGLKKGMSAFNMIAKIFKSKEDKVRRKKEAEVESEEAEVVTREEVEEVESEPVKVKKEKPVNKKKRFFTKSGKSLNK